MLFFDDWWIVNKLHMQIVKSSFIHSRGFQAAVHVWLVGRWGRQGPIQVWLLGHVLCFYFWLLPGWHKENVLLVRDVEERYSKWFRDVPRFIWCYKNILYTQGSV
jgi:hypothetical protein